MSDTESKPLDLTIKTRRGRRLKVWWIPQVPMKPFEILVDSLVEAKILLESLAQYDLFQFENKIKLDYSNTGGACVLDDNGEWEDFEDENGDDIDSPSLAECVELDHDFQLVAV